MKRLLALMLVMVLMIVGIAPHAVLAEETETEVLDGMVFDGASLLLQHNFAVNYKVEKALLDSLGVVDPYLETELAGIRRVVKPNADEEGNYILDEGKYIFTYRDISPALLNETITATLYGCVDGVVYAGETKEYSVAEYCYNTLQTYASDEYAELRTLLVNLLNYGAASQVYTDYKTDALVNKNLTDTQRSWGTAAEPALENIFDAEFMIYSNSEAYVDFVPAAWAGAALILDNAVTLRMRISTESTAALYAKIEACGQEWIIPAKKFVEEDGAIYLYFNGLHAGQMREPVCLTLYRTLQSGADIEPPEYEEVEVSNTARYSIESYAYEMQNSDNALLKELLSAMMKYGDAAQAYSTYLEENG